MSTPKLHIYGQEAFHDDVWIVGDHEALTLLRDTVARALCVGGSTTKRDVFCSDGEGYSVRVRVMFRGDDEWKSLAMPYTAEFAQSGSGQHPEVMFHTEQQR